MHVTLVHVYVKPEYLDEFIEASRLNHEASIKESGNRRFDILQDKDDVMHFILYEAYANSEDTAAHKNTSHYLKWRETVATMMVKPREGVQYNCLFPKG